MGEMIVSPGAYKTLYDIINKLMKVEDKGAASSTNTFDLDTALTPQTFYCTSANKGYIANKPTDTACMVYVFGSGTRIMQLFINSLNEYYCRYFVAGTDYGWEKLALDSNTYLLSGGTQIPENANIDTYTTPGKYGTASSVSARTMYGLPYERGSTNNYAFNLIVENSAFNDVNTRRQTLQFYNSPTKWVRYGTVSSWTTSWADDVGTLKSKVVNKGNVKNGSPCVLNVENGSKGIIIIGGSSDAMSAIYYFYVSSNGAVIATKIIDNSSNYYTLNTTTNNQITITSTTNNTSHVNLIMFS